MEWSREKTMKLIELLQGNASLWNSTLCQTRRDKQKRRNELKNIADILEVYVADVTRKIQHLRTQYNREWMRELRANTDNPEDPYVSSWYAFEYLHFLKHSSKPYRVLEADDNGAAGNEPNLHSEILNDSKHQVPPPAKMARLDQPQNSTIKSEDPQPCSKDDLSLFGEYIANELRSVKSEKNLLVAKKKILDIIFEVKMENPCDGRSDSVVYSTNSMNSDKVFTPTITTSQIEPLASHSTAISEIIINSACHYSNFKVDTQ